MQIKKEFIKSLLNEVILEFEDRCLIKYIKNEDDKFHHNVLLSKFAIRVFAKEQRQFYSNFKELLRFYENLNIPYRVVKRGLACFLRLYQNWVKKYKVVMKDFFFEIRNLYIDVFNSYPYKIDKRKDENNINSDDNFFFIEDEGVDEVIEEMHYDDSSKISAEEFFNSYDMDMDLSDLVYLKDIFNETLDVYDEFSEAFIERFVMTTSKLLTSLEFAFTTKEFSDIGLALNKLVQLLSEMNIEDEQTQELVYNLLVTFIEDLSKWLKNIFIEQSAVDIHYLDASLLANVAQFEMILKNGNEIDVDDNMDIFEEF